MDRLEAAKSAYINQWKHCDKQLTALSPNIVCDCGQSWPWVGTLGSTMEMLEWSEDVTPRAASDTPQPGLMF